MTDVAGPNTATRILDAIRAHWNEAGFSPSIKEIMRAANISSTSVVAYHLKQLEKKGFIKRTPHTARSIVVAAESNR